MTSKLYQETATSTQGKKEICRPPIGTHSKREEPNYNGEKLINFALEKNMVIRSTRFEHKGIHNAIWISPDQKTLNQMDHVVLDKQHMEVIKRRQKLQRSRSGFGPLSVETECKINGRPTATKKEAKNEIKAWRK